MEDEAMEDDEAEDEVRISSLTILFLYTILEHRLMRARRRRKTMMTRYPLNSIRHRIRCAQEIDLEMDDDKVHRNSSQKN